MKRPTVRRHDETYGEGYSTIVLLTLSNHAEARDPLRARFFTVEHAAVLTTKHHDGIFWRSIQPALPSGGRGITPDGIWWRVDDCSPSRGAVMDCTILGPGLDVQ